MLKKQAECQVSLELPEFCVYMLMVFELAQHKITGLPAHKI